MPSSSLYQHITARDVVDALAEVVKVMGWEKVYLHGGSWGSTMCLLFAEFYPEMVLGMVVRGIFLGTKEELDVTFDQSVVCFLLLFLFILIFISFHIFRLYRDISFHFIFFLVLLFLFFLS